MPVLRNGDTSETKSGAMHPSKPSGTAMAQSSAPRFAAMGPNEVRRALLTAERSRVSLSRVDTGRNELSMPPDAAQERPPGGTLSGLRARFPALGGGGGTVIRQEPGGGLLSVCSNPDCRTGWLKLWRRRKAPIFEGRWACGERCMEAVLRAAVYREMSGGFEAAGNVSNMGSDGGANAAGSHRHRIPLGLVLLAQGWITQAQLRQALDAQKERGKGRIGSWLVGQGVLEESRVTRALSMQWGCPVLSLAGHQPERVAALVPRLLIDALGMLPVRVAGGRVLYLAFEDRVDAAAAFAVERMSGLQVEPGVVAASEFLPSYERMMDATYPKAQLAEAGSAAELASLLTEAVERIQPVQSRLVRLHQYFWMRCWRSEASAPGLRGQDEDERGTRGSDVAGRPAVELVPRAHEVEDMLISYGGSN